MKLVPALLASASLFVCASAFAQQPATVVKTADYVEQNLGGDQVVKFTGDELVGPAGGAYGMSIRRPPGVMRVGLIRPRLNFVSELLKTVENL